MKYSRGTIGFGRGMSLDDWLRGKYKCFLGERWRVDRMIITKADSLHFNPFLHVLDLLVASSKVWDSDLINSLLVEWTRISTSSGRRSLARIRSIVLITFS